MDQNVIDHSSVVRTVAEIRLHGGRRDQRIVTVFTRLVLTPGERYFSRAAVADFSGALKIYQHAHEIDEVIIRQVD